MHTRQSSCVQKLSTASCMCVNRDGSLLDPVDSRLDTRLSDSLAHTQEFERITAHSFDSCHGDCLCLSCTCKNPNTRTHTQEPKHQNPQRLLTSCISRMLSFHAADLLQARLWNIHAHKSTEADFLHCLDDVISRSRASASLTMALSDTQIQTGLIWIGENLRACQCWRERTGYVCSTIRTISSRGSRTWTGSPT